MRAQMSRYAAAERGLLFERDEEARAANMFFRAFRNVPLSTMRFADADTIHIFTLRHTTLPLRYAQLLLYLSYAPLRLAARCRTAIIRRRERLRSYMISALPPHAERVVIADIDACAIDVICRATCADKN